jgi:hypothetical protein
MQSKAVKNMSTLAEFNLASAVTDNRQSGISAHDRQFLAEFEKLRDRLRDRVRSVALNFQIGAYLVGRPGTGKTHIVEETLKGMEAMKDLHVSYVLKNAKMTAPGLFKLLSDYRESTIVLDDIPSLHVERPAQMMLMAALNGRAGVPRKVSYTMGEKDGRRGFDFVGGIIAISNVPLRRDPLADAIASRVPLLEFEPTDDMIAAFMRFEALKGYRSVIGSEAEMVVEFLIDESRSGEYRLDLRAMYKALNDYEMWRYGYAKCHWHELVRSFLKKLTILGGSTPIRRAEKRDRFIEIAAEILAKYPERRQRKEREAEWFTQTQLSSDQLYRYQAQAKGLQVA